MTSPRKSSSRIALAVTAALAASVALSAAPTCFADEPPADAAATAADRAEQYAAQAFAAYTSGDHARAVTLYRNAFDLVQSADLLYNIARVYDVGLHDRARALHFYQRYVRAPGAVAERIEKAQQRIDELHAAERAMLEGGPFDIPVAPVTAPEAARITATEAVHSAPAPHSYWSAPRIAAVACGVAGLAGIGIGTGYGMAALLEPEEAAGQCASSSCSAQTGAAGDDKGSVATLALLAGGTLLGTGAVLWIVSPTAHGDRPGSDAVRVSAAVSASKLGLELSGAW